MNLKELFPRRWGEEPGYKEVLQQRAGSLNIKWSLLIKENQISQVKEFSTFPCKGRSSRGSLKSCLLYSSQLSGGEGNGTPLQYSCLENPMDRGTWWAAVHGVAKSQTRLSDFTFTFHFHALEKEMAIHSSVLAWRIPGTAEPGGLPSMGSHGVRHDWSDLAAAAAIWGQYSAFFTSWVLWCLP